MANIFQDRIKVIVSKLPSGKIMTYDELKSTLGLPYKRPIKDVIALIEGACKECEKNDLKLAHKIRTSFKAVPSRQLWLNGHLHSKDRYEIIGRSLVPFELFDLVDWESIIDNDQKWGYVVYNGREYQYLIHRWGMDCREESKNPDERYYVIIEFKKLVNPMPDNKKTFKVVLDKSCSLIITAMFWEPNYGGEDGIFYENIFKDFRALNFDAITRYNSKSLQDMLARYLIFVICDKDTEKFGGYTAFEKYFCGDKNELIMLSKGEDWVMYAFDKEEANIIAQRLRYYCNSLKIIYFRNNNFIDDSYFKNMRDDNVKLISIKEFYSTISMSEQDRLYIEKQALYLISLINDEDISDWDEQFYANEIKKYYANQEGVNFAISNFLLEDAINVITEGIRNYNSKYDWFHYLCAANLINRFVGDYRANHPDEDYKQNNWKWYNFKPKLYHILIEYLKKYRSNKLLNIAFQYHPPKEGIEKFEKPYRNLIMISIKIEDIVVQFSFTGIKTFGETFEKFGVVDGTWSNIRLQPIAPILYKYSYCLRWRKLKDIVTDTK